MRPICFYRIDVAKSGRQVEDQEPGRGGAAATGLSPWPHGTDIVAESDTACREEWGHPGFSPREGNTSLGHELNTWAKNCSEEFKSSQHLLSSESFTSFQNPSAFLNENKPLHGLWKRDPNSPMFWGGNIRINRPA